MTLAQGKMEWQTVSCCLQLHDNIRMKSDASYQKKLHLCTHDKSTVLKENMQLPLYMSLSHNSEWRYNSRNSQP